MDYFPPINGDQLDPDRPYINANPDSGIEGSWPNAKAIEGSMREIINVIEAAGLSPDGNDFTQLADAIAALILAAVPTIDYASNSDANTGTATNKSLTPANFGGQQLKAQTGYQKLPGGIIIQWGRGGTGTTSFPVAFPNACWTVIATDEASVSNTGINNTGVDSLTTTNFGLRNSGSGAFISYWMAIGN